MGTSDVIAILALIVSLGSGAISFWAFKHSVRVHDLDANLAFDRDRSELLVHLEESRALFASSKLELEEVQLALSHVQDQAQSALIDHDKLLAEFQRKLAGAERQASILWGEVFDWQGKQRKGAIAHHAPRYRSLIASDRVVNDAALVHIANIRHLLAHEEDRARSVCGNALI